MIPRHPVPTIGNVIFLGQYRDADLYCKYHNEINQFVFSIEDDYEFVWAYLNQNVHDPALIEAQKRAVNIIVHQ